MKFLENIGAKLGDANEALATAQKSWRDGNLAAREEALGQREREHAQKSSELATQLVELRRIEGQRFRRKLFYIVSMIAVGALSFLAGVGVGQRPVVSKETKSLVAPRIEPAPPPSLPITNSAATPSPSPTVEPTSSDPDIVARDGGYGTGNNFDVGRYCLDKEKQGGVTFEQCLGLAALSLKATR